MFQGLNPEPLGATPSTSPVRPRQLRKLRLCRSKMLKATLLDSPKQLEFMRCTARTRNCSMWECPERYTFRLIHHPALDIRQMIAVRNIC